MGFAQGIDICYGSTNDCRNVVFFHDGTHRDYRVGGILEEIVRDDVVTMLTDGVREKIDEMDGSAGDGSSIATLDPMWYRKVFETFDDKTAPAAGALLRSSFYEAVMHGSVRQLGDENTDNCALARECCDYYLDRFSTFAVLVEAIASKGSGCADEETSRLVEMLDEWADGYSEIFGGGSIVFRDSGVVTIAEHRVVSWLPLLLLEYSRIRKRKKCIRFCENCGRIFVPQKRSDAIYCDQPSPQNPDRRCNEIGAQIRRQRKRNASGEERAHHNTICRLHNMVRRARNRGDADDLISYYRRKIDAEMLRYRAEKEHDNKDK